MEECQGVSKDRQQNRKIRPGQPQKIRVVPGVVLVAFFFWVPTKNKRETSPVFFCRRPDVLNRVQCPGKHQGEKQNIIDG